MMHARDTVAKIGTRPGVVRRAVSQCFRPFFRHSMPRQMDVMRLNTGSRSTGIKSAETPRVRSVQCARKSLNVADVTGTAAQQHANRFTIGGVYMVVTGAATCQHTVE